jgi:hypothetical protein
MEVALIKISYFKHLKHIESQWVAHAKKNQIGHGDVGDLGDGAAQVDFLRSENAAELKTPVATLMDTAPMLHEEEKPSSDNRFNSFIEKLKLRYRPQARKLLTFLSRFPHVVDWNESGQLTFKDVPLTSANLNMVLPLVFYGSRQKFTPGTTEFFRALEELNLSGFIQNKSKLPTTKPIAREHKTSKKASVAYRWYRI